MNDEKIYDVAIIGGGLAGLSLSILMRRKGYEVILFEKESYPHHKVCGEYISMESYDFLKDLGLPLDTMNLPVISTLVVSAPNGIHLDAGLSPGGFGISRYRIDHALAQVAKENGVEVMENCKAENVTYNNEEFEISATAGIFKSRVCCGTFGKRSNLDIRWARPFSRAKGKLNNYIGVKYHVHTTHPVDTIALHNFKDGYCGISSIEDGKYCLCYLTTAANLNKAGNIQKLEQDVLSKNIYLKNIFTSSQKIIQPVSISQVSFEKKSLVHDHILMTGDAAGMITPLCGNGMSMAMHGAKILSGFVDHFLQKKITRADLERGYATEWTRTFSSRLHIGRMIQRFFGKTWLTNSFVWLMRKNPAITRWLISKTHGSF